MTEIRKHQIYDEEQIRKQKCIDEFCLLDDEFMSEFFEGRPECIELVLQIILDKPDLKVKEVHTQVTFANINGKSVRLDVVAEDSSGKNYDVEIQRENKGAISKRARCHSSMIDAKTIKKGIVYNDIRDSYVIFVTEKDIFGLGKPLYHIERMILETKELFNDGAHIIYANGAYRDDTPLGKLMHDFACKDPIEMNYKILANRSKELKGTEEGGKAMGKALEEYGEFIEKRAKIENSKEIARNFLSTGNISIELIAKNTGLTVEEVKELEEDITVK